MPAQQTDKAREGKAGEEILYFLNTLLDTDSG